MHHLSDKNPKNAPFVGLWSVQSSQRPDYEAWSHAAVHQNSDASAGSNMRNPSRQHAPYVHKHQPIAPALIPERCVPPLNHTNCSSAQLTASQDLQWNHELCGCLVQSSVGEMQSLPLFMKSQLFCAIVFILVVKTDSWSLFSLGSKTTRGHGIVQPKRHNRCEISAATDPTPTEIFCWWVSRRSQNYGPSSGIKV